MKLLGLIRGGSGTPRSHTFHTPEGKLSAQKFDADEICILEKTWQDLADRSNGKGIDKETFLQYFPLNGLLGDRLFAQFDKRKTGYIDFEEFISGLATVCRGTIDDKIHFVFNMYDVSHDSTVSKQELSTLLNHIPKEAFRNSYPHASMSGYASPIPRNPSNSSISNLNATTLATVNMHGMHSAHSPMAAESDSEKGSVQGSIHDNTDYEDVDFYTNHDMVERAFAECDLNHEGRLTYEEFKMWIERNPQILDYIESILPYNGPKDIAPHHDKKETLPHMKRLATKAMLHRSNSISLHIDPAAQEIFGHVNPSTSSRRLTRGSHGFESPLSSTSVSRNHSFAGPGMMAAGPPTAGSGLPTPSNNSLSSVERGTSGNLTGGIAAQGIAAQGISGVASDTDSEEQARLHLAQAMECTQNPDLKAAIHALLEMMLTPEPITASDIYHAAVRMEGALYKRGKSLFHSLTKRYYLVSSNCMYYYTRQADVRPKGVIFLTGSIIERVKEDDMALKGYYGFEITHQDLCTGEHHRHDKRILYTRSEEEREKWVSALQHAAHVVPIEDDYVIGKELGRGRFSVVCECVHKMTGVHCAVKIIDKTTIEPEEKSLLRTEIAVLKLVNHPNIIKMMGLYESKQYIYIVMEMLKGGELFERIVGRPRFTELEAAKLMRPLLESVAYLHDLGIVHRDLKPENILCGEELEDLKIADFGLSKMILPKEKMDAACGTLSYVAPEVLTMQGYGKEADLWSVGVILFLLLCGKLPFDGDDHNEIIRSTIQADLKVNPVVWNKLSEDARNFITSLLNKNPK